MLLICSSDIRDLPIQKSLRIWLCFLICYWCHLCLRQDKVAGPLRGKVPCIAKIPLLWTAVCQVQAICAGYGLKCILNIRVKIQNGLYIDLHTVSKLCTPCAQLLVATFSIAACNVLNAKAKASRWLEAILSASDVPVRFSLSWRWKC